MAHPTLTATSERLTQAIYYGDNLSANVGSGFAPTSRTIATTAPLGGGGDLSSNRTLTVATFTGSDPGVVPTSTGSATRYLRDDGTWVEIFPLVPADYVEVTVESGGATWRINNGVVGTAKLGVDITTAGKALLDDANVAAQRATLELGTAALLNVAASDDAAANEVVKGNDSRLVDSRTPKDHTHPQSAVVGLQADLATKITTDGTARSIFKKNDSVVGTRRGLNLIEGTNITITMADDGTNEEVECTIASTGGSVSEPTYGDIEFTTTDTTDDTWAVKAAAITRAKMADMGGTARLVGSSSSATGMTEITLGSNISMTGTVINVSSGTMTVGNGTYSDITVSGDAPNEGTIWTIGTGKVNTTKMGDDVTTAGKALLTGANAAAQRTTLGLAIGTDVQAYDAELAAIAGLTSAADKAPYFTGSGTAALANFTAFGRQIVGGADQATVQTTLGVRPGVDIQVYDADLAALASVTSAADKVPYFTGAGTASVADFTAAGRTLVGGANATAQRSSLGLSNLAIATASGATKLLGRGADAGAGNFEEITVGSGLTMTGTTLSASGGAASFETGMIMMWPTATPPSGWLLCDGSAVSRATYSALFSVLTVPGSPPTYPYGSGNGSTTFNVPNLKQRFPLGKADTGTGNALGGTGGAIDHTHTVNPTAFTSGGVQNEGGWFNLGGTGNSTYATHDHSIDVPSTTSSTNNPPYLVVNFIIKT